MKFNMGCGFNKLEGFVNVDKFSECSPDLQMDLEKFPWPIEDNQSNEVIFNHSLEHLGQDTEVFLGIIKELYRISRDNSKVMINVPHPRHDSFLGDPTHVRVITPEVLSLLSKKNNLYWKKVNASNSPLAIYLNVDFEVVNTIQILDPYYSERLDKNELPKDVLSRLIKEKNNVIQEYNFVLRVLK